MTEKTSSIHEVVKKVQSVFKEIAGIHVFARPQSGSKMVMTVHTPIVEHDKELPFSSEQQVIVSNDERTKRFDLDIVTSEFGPKTLESETQTPIYIADDVMGAKPIEIQEGLSKLREKLFP